MDTSPFSRLLSLLKCTRTPVRPTFYSTLRNSIVRTIPPVDAATQNRRTIPQTFSPRKRNSIDKTAGAPSLLRMILTRGTKCTAVIKSDPSLSLTFFLSLLFSCRLTVVPFARFDRENSEAVTPFRDLTFPPFFFSPSVLFLSRPSPPITIILIFSVCSNNRVIPRVVYRLSSDTTV